MQEIGRYIMVRREKAIVNDAHLPALVLLFILLLAGCDGPVIQHPYYKGEMGKITEGMTQYKEKNMDFLVPPGWTRGTDEALSEVYIEQEGGVVSFVKEGKGTLLVWCMPGVRQLKIIRDVVDRVAPDNVKTKGPFQISSFGFDPYFEVYDAFWVEKGEQKGFRIFIAWKQGSITKLYGCYYGVLAKTNSFDNADEVENDFLAVVRSLKN